MIRRSEFSWRQLLSLRALLMVWAPVALVTLLHYSTAAAHHWLHDVFRRLYYIPIVLAAFAFGLRGSLVAATTAATLYAPHAFTRFLHHDPGSGTEKLLEILLYLVIAAVAGVLADREFRERRRQEETARRLAVALEEKEEAERMLIRAGRLKALGEMTAGLAHEMKNPFGSIQGAAEVILDEIPENSPRRRMGEILMQELRRLGAILDRFLSFARPEVYDLRRVSLCAVVNQVVELMAAQASQHGVMLHVHRPTVAPIVLGERDRIEQVVMNLILNGLQAMPGGGTLRLSCGVREVRHRPYGVVCIEDEGPGIPEEIREKIFDPFFTTKDAGSGLGLAIAARIVDQHGGFIEAGNRPEGGARFEVFLPLAEPATVPDTRIECGHDSGSGTGSGRG